MSLPPIDNDKLISFLIRLLNTPSPTGLAGNAINLVKETLKPLPGFSFQHTRKGALLAVWDGAGGSPARALTAHVDTLGAMVKEIKANGRLKLTQVGGYAWNAVEGEGCTVLASGGNQVRGAVLLDKSSVHVYGAKVNEARRETDVMEVRLDERTASMEETRALGIDIGDYVAFDPRVEVVNSFIRSRHLDDKACVACLISAVHALAQAGLQPTHKTYLYISNYEEAGHGASAGIPADTGDLLVVDMAAVGEGQASDEFHPTLCVKDSGGPYHHDFSQRLRRMAEQFQIPYKVDIYPFYGSDGGAYLRAGADVAVALIGPGVDASHSYERTHLDALLATTRWIMAYLLEK
ncbi:MAG: M42 family metallopeptidase [Anaerolineaceae bacterium]|nr:M42 family metallopeptidase [Anaerolineaceae bacterium]